MKTCIFLIGDEGTLVGRKDSLITILHKEKNAKKTHWCVLWIRLGQ